MKLILKIIKWIGKFIGGILLLLILSGLGYRLFSSKPVPPGKLVDVNGTELHIRVDGEKNNLPTLILESGANSHTDMLHWVAEGLKNNMRVIRYDREGKWFSEESNEKISPEFYARQLHDLLEKNGEKPPYIMAGHSMGGSYIRIFRDLYPNEVKALIFIDSTHPEQWKRLNQNSLINESQINSMKLVASISDMGLRGIYNIISAPKPKNDGLPKECHIRNLNLASNSGKVYRRYLKENEINNSIFLRTSESSSLDSLPVLVFTAKEQYTEFHKRKLREKGIDPENELDLWYGMQKELKELSSNGKQIIMEANHGSIITKKENAEVVNREILSLTKKIVK
ncbi:alpha/beta fold hydrolase [Winogradskyella eximia]|uniref:alpha/beta fold hydrolase n=1 Tax=Winogradskyella eximia TaxID=262006 RepID=UPI0024909CE0|nr:alpha/beta hydrolase [Winogradskyella eximia]